jgi:hypothetical protein
VCEWMHVFSVLMIFFFAVPTKNWPTFTDLYFNTNKEPRVDGAAEVCLVQEMSQGFRI